LRVARAIKGRLGLQANTQIVVLKERVQKETAFLKAAFTPAGASPSISTSLS
jgi:hypothetical protein